jgi:hypothetical protein
MSRIFIRNVNDFVYALVSIEAVFDESKLFSTG